MFRIQPLSVPSSLTLHYHTNAPNHSSNETLMPIDRALARERSLSPDSLEQRLLKQQQQQQQIMTDEADDESVLTSSSSMIDSMSIERSQPTVRPSTSTKTILKTLSSHGLLTTLSFPTENDEDFDDDLDEIHFDQNEVNLLFSDPDDGTYCRLTNEMIEIEEDYDDDQDGFYGHIRPLPMINAEEAFFASSLVFPDPEPQYSPFHFLDPISEAASEEERRAAMSILRQQQQSKQSQQQQKHKHSTSSSLSISAHGHCEGDTTINDDLSTLSDIDDQNTSMDENSISQSSSILHDQHIHKKRCHRAIRSTDWINRKIGRKFDLFFAEKEINSIETY